MDYAPLITTQPVSLSVNPGQPVAFTAAANANPTPTVQWQLSTDGGSHWSDVSGATDTTLNVTNSATTALSGNEYRAVFTNSVGSTPTNSVTLTVNLAPAITTQPTSQLVTIGATANFSAQASGTPTPAVQWQVSTDGGKTFSNVSGGTSPTLTLTNIGASLNGNEYRATFTNSRASVTTNTVTLTVNSPLIHITTPPAGQTIAAPKSVTFTAAATGTPTPTVQWQISTDGGNTFTNINGATKAKFTLSGTTLALSGNQYRAVFTNKTGSTTNSAATTAATLTVDLVPTITTQPASLSFNAGQSVTFTTAATANPTATVQWQVSTDGGKTFSNVAGATSTTLTFNADASQNKDQFRAVFTNPVGSATTHAATLTVNFAPIITTSPLSQTVAPGRSVNFTAAARANGAATVQWQVSTDGGKTFTNLTSSTATKLTLTLTATTAMNGNEYRAVFTNSLGSTNTSAATLTVGVAPTITAQPASQAALVGRAVNLSAAASGTPAPTAQWQVSLDGGNTWMDVIGATADTLTVTATTALELSMYRAVYTSSGGRTATRAATLYVF